MEVSQDTDTFNGDVIAKRIADAQRLKEAERMVSTLVDDPDGQWLNTTITGMRKSPAVVNFNRGGAVSEAERTFSFRSPVAGHVLSGGHESEHYRSFTMPVGSRVMKVRGIGYRDWLFRVDNNIEDWGRIYLHLGYNADRQLMLMRHYSYAAMANGGRAGARSKGARADRSVG